MTETGTIQPQGATILEARFQQGGVPRFPGQPNLGFPNTTAYVKETLEARMAKFEDLVTIPIDGKTDEEALVAIEEATGLTYFQRSPGLIENDGYKVFVREGILEQLKYAGELLEGNYPGYKLGVLEGHRSLEQQVKEFKVAVTELRKEPEHQDASSLDDLLAMNMAEPTDEDIANLTTEDKKLLNAAHLRSAAPAVGDHVAGCGVDLVIIDENGAMVDMGTEMSEWVDESYTFSPFISQDGKNARQVLLEIMAAAGFDNFEGEMWHFMSGGRESAYLHQLKKAKYGPKKHKDPALDGELADREYGSIEAKRFRFMRHMATMIVATTALEEREKNKPEKKRQEGPTIQRAYQPPKSSPKMRITRSPWSSDI
jgi:D-alanyl-D-alanine dipeptidase